MRLIAWNANFNNQKRTLEQDVALLEPLAPDIVVLSETAAPAAGNPLNAAWFGDKNPGLAVVAGEDLELCPHRLNPGSPRLTAGFRVSGRANFDLLAIWPVQDKASRVAYHQILMDSLSRYVSMFDGGRVVMAGDFNSNTRVSCQQKSHPEFVRAAGLAGVVSIYHALTGEEHGQETAITYRHGYSMSRAFHIDYCFASSPISHRATWTIANGEEWLTTSDHFPVIVDFDSAVLAAADNDP